MKRSLLVLLVCLATLSISVHAQNGTGYADEFDGGQLDLTKWDIFKGSPLVTGGKLILNGDMTRADLQSKQSFKYGLLTMAIESANWQPQAGVPVNQVTDASFGVEIFGGANGQCHYSAVLKANGHLGLLRPLPDANNNCSGDPTFQEHLPLSNWETIRAGGRVVMMLFWTPQGVTLRISDGNSLNGITMSIPGSQAVPDVFMRIRLNADINESYQVDYIRWAELPPAINPNEFVISAGGKLMIGDREFRFAGANTYYLQPEIAYGNIAGVREVLDKMQATGLTVARTIGFNDHPYKNMDARCGGLTSEVNGNDPASIQLRPGVFCEPNLVALDQAIAEAGSRNIRLIVYLTNNFTAYGGIRRYVQWRLGVPPTDEQVGLFYTDEIIRQWFKNYVAMLLNRVNTVTGVRYKDEPAILAWELGNELRNHTNNINERVQRIDDLLAWHHEMAGYIKSIDSNHLVSDGGEGHDNDSVNYPGLSNSYPVSGFESCSFSRLVNEPLIDLVSYHFYPSKWGLNETGDAEIWIRVHEQLARTAGKIAYLGEYGKPSGGAVTEAFDINRAETFDRWLQWAINDYCTTGQIVWQLNYDARADSDGYSIYSPRDVHTIRVLWRAAADLSGPAISITPSSLPMGTVGTTYSQTLTQTGGSGTVIWSLTGALPAGLTFDDVTATLSGTPTQSGNFNLVVTATDANHCSGTVNYTLSITCPTIIVHPATLPNAITGMPYSQGLTQTGGVGTITWSVSVGSLPASLTLDPETGILSGISAADGVFKFTVRATDTNNCFGEREYELASGAMTGYEADVASRPNGSGTVVVSDWVQVGRFSVGLDTPTPGSEFQRADCAPRNTLGDGKITVADWVQAGRYSVGLDPLTPAGGPLQSASALSQLAQIRRASFQDLPRSLRILNQRLTPGQRSVSVPVELQALGGENALSFTLEFDPGTLSFDGYEAVRDAQVLIQPGQLEQGKVGIVLAMRPGMRLAAGSQEVIRLKFKVIKASAGLMDLNFVDGLIPLSLVSAEAEALPVRAVGLRSGRDESNWPSRLHR